MATQETDNVYLGNSETKELQQFPSEDLYRYGSWEKMHTLLLECHAGGHGPDAKRIAVRELEMMAKLADAYVALVEASEKAEGGAK